MTPVIYEARPSFWDRHGWKVCLVAVLLAVLTYFWYQGRDHRVVLNEQTTWRGIL